MADTPVVLTGILDPLASPDLPASLDLLASPDPLASLDPLASPDPPASPDPLELPAALEVPDPLELPALLGVQELVYKVLPPLVLQPLQTIKPDKLLLIRAAAML